MDDYNSFSGLWYALALITAITIALETLGLAWRKWRRRVPGTPVLLEKPQPVPQEATVD